MPRPHLMLWIHAAAVYALAGCQTSTAHEPPAPAPVTARVAPEAVVAEEEVGVREIFAKIVVGMTEAEVAQLLQGVRVVKQGAQWTFVEVPEGAPQVGRTYAAYRVTFGGGVVIDKQSFPGFDVTGEAPKPPDP